MSTKLTAAAVKSLSRPGKYGDGRGGHGLRLIVVPTGAKCWVQRIVIKGRRREIGLGGYPLVSLAEARRIAFENHKTARSGGDPVAERRRGEVPTFEEAAMETLELLRPSWRNAKHAAQWEATLRQYAFKRLGRIPVSDVNTADVMAVLTPIWLEIPETARRVRQRVGAVMKWSVAQGHRQDNPAGDAIAAALPKNNAGKKHHRAIHYDEVGDAVRAIRESQAGEPVKLAFEFLVLTAARSGEVRGARWDEMDFEAGTWTVPGERMKAKREHRVPLSGRALEILHEAAQYNDDSGLVFMGTRTGKPMSDATLGKLLREHGVDATPHGFRSSFRNWASERARAPREVSEAALAHTVKDKTEAAYMRTDLFEVRRELMESWARYLGKGKAQVVRIAAHG